jgi:glycerate 2-kinase
MKYADAKAVLADIHQAALSAVAPGPVLLRALQDDGDAFAGDRVWIVALGKAAQPMAAAAVQALTDRGRAPAGGLVVASAAGPRPHASMPVLVGDHPEPGAGSLAAAEALARLVEQVAPKDTVWVLLSGGTTSLIGAPQPGISGEELKALYTELLRSGLDITAMNRVRKRFTRWSAGRLARSLAPARVRCYIVSDVVGDDLASIGSGPCVPDVATAQEVRQALVAARLWDRLSPSLRHHLDAVDRGDSSETPKPGDAAFERVVTKIVASNRLALDAAGRRARERGLVTEFLEAPLVGEAADAGARIARRLLGTGRDPDDATPARCLIAGGETTVTFTGAQTGTGGRSQELALAAARALRGAPVAVALLAAGTDGRDGPTDAAGAVVDTTTWDRIAAAGRDPQRDLENHDSYAALASADALLRTGQTGTNVMDIVLGIT